MTQRKQSRILHIPLIRTSPVSLSAFRPPSFPCRREPRSSHQSETCNRVVKHLGSLLVAAILCLACSAVAQAWDVLYDAGSGALPSGAQPSWKSSIRNGDAADVSEGVLHIAHNNGTGYFYREPWSIEAGVPVTVEARMRVENTSVSSPVISIQTKGGSLLSVFALIA